MALAPFIVGVGRSGTTLLRLMLDAHPDLAVPMETHFLPAVLAADSVEGACRAMVASPTWPNLGTSERLLRRRVAADGSRTAADVARSFYKVYAAERGKSRWGDKTPTYRAQLLPISAALPEARFVHLIRDGRDVALSYRGLWFGPGDAIEVQARFWREEILATRAAGAEIGNYLEVRYEDLLLDPASELRRICDHIELSYSDEMLSYHARAAARLDEIVVAFSPGRMPGLQEFKAIHDRTHEPPDPGRIGGWRRGMTDAEVNAYKAIAGPLLTDLGYPD